VVSACLGGHLTNYFSKVKFPGGLARGGLIAVGFDSYIMLGCYKEITKSDTNFTSRTTTNACEVVNPEHQCSNDPNVSDTFTQRQINYIFLHIFTNTISVLISSWSTNKSLHQIIMMSHAAQKEGWTPSRQTVFVVGQT
jgi:hypothetical protein